MKNTVYQVLAGIALVLFSISVNNLSAQSTDEVLAKNKPKLPDNALKLPLVNQETNYSCGTASFLSIIKYWVGYSKPEKDLYAVLETTPENGTHPLKLTQAANSFGLKAELKENLHLQDLGDFLKQGATVIVNIQAWREEPFQKLPWWDNWEDGHYVVLIAMDSTYAYFMDPSATEDHYGYIPLDELPARWHDYENEEENKTVRRYFQSVIVYWGKTAPKYNQFSSKKLERIL